MERPHNARVVEARELTADDGRTGHGRSNVCSVEAESYTVPVHLARRVGSAVEKKGVPVEAPVEL